MKWLTRNTQYNIACLFSLTGRYEEALHWLDRSIIGDSKYRQPATEDEDLASLRDHPEFGPQFHRLVTGNSHRPLEEWAQEGVCTIGWSSVQVAGNDVAGA